jgi:hypothetical protein
MTAAASLDDRRVDIVNEHMRLENAHDFPGCVGVFQATGVPKQTPDESSPPLKQSSLNTPATRI